MLTRRAWHAGPQVIVGGSEPTGEFRIQYYTPAYLLNGLPRPSITSAPSTATYNAYFSLSYTLSGDTVNKCATRTRCSSARLQPAQLPARMAARRNRQTACMLSPLTVRVMHETFMPF